MAACKIITVANQKGGTGKSSTVANLAYTLGEMGKKVLAVDLDPQANLSMAFGVEAPDKITNAIHHLMNTLMDDRQLPDKKEYILTNGKADFIPSNLNLLTTEMNLRDEMGGEHTLADLLEPLRAGYEFILIDTNPYLGLLTINALAACDSVLIPVSPQLWSATGLTDLLRTIHKIRRKINPRLKIEGILLTMCDIRTNLYREAKQLIAEHYGGEIPMFQAEIPMTVRVGEANYLSMSVSRLDPRNRAALAYGKLAEEVVRRETGTY